MSTSHGEQGSDSAFHVRGLQGLSSTATRFLKQHPREARLAVTAALEAAAVQYKSRLPQSDTRQVPERLRPFIDASDEEKGILNTSQAAKRLRISRTTVYAWVEKGVLLGWRSTKRGMHIPEEQILGPGKLVPGLAQVLHVFDDPELAWAFLDQEHPFAKTTARPLDMLKAGAVDDVIAAAESFGHAPT